jgi:hypothetical protein
LIVEQYFWVKAAALWTPRANSPNRARSKCEAIGVVGNLNIYALGKARAQRAMPGTTQLSSPEDISATALGAVESEVRVKVCGWIRRRNWSAWVISELLFVGKVERD